ncbi:MAG: hypothetical protein K0S31_4061 [Sphingobacterium multivorum]|jgi:hypothetical protein|nr:hypothetical protein [Sphingobacterium multivorum]
MKTKYIFFASIFALTAVMQGCRKYVEVEQYNRRELKYTTDYAYLLNNTTVFSPSFSTPILSSDDITFANLAYQQQQIESIAWPYIWSSQLVPDNTEDLNWSRPYKQIYTANEVIAGVMHSEDGSEKEKRALLAEAKIQRAYAYFVLANLYGDIYDPQTAGNAMGVPLLLQPDLFASLKRAPLAQVYAQILQDLNEALVDIPTTASNNRHPNKAAVEALLAIVHLHMRNFDLAATHADAALQYNATLLDLQLFAASASGYPLPFNHPETYFLKQVGQMIDQQLNPELVSLFDTKDLRRTVYMQAGTGQMPSGALRSKKMSVMVGAPNAGPSVPEMLLIKAEVAARKGNTATAMEFVNKLRAKRFKQQDFTPLSATSADQALQIIVDERRREFFGTGLRWLDMRRFNLDAKLAKEFKRQFINQEYTLKINSASYVYPVANKYLQLNPEIGQRPM